MARVCDNNKDENGNSTDFLKELTYDSYDVSLNYAGEIEKEKDDKSLVLEVSNFDTVNDFATSCALTPEEEKQKELMKVFEEVVSMPFFVSTSGYTRKYQKLFDTIVDVDIKRIVGKQLCAAYTSLMKYNEVMIMIERLENECNFDPVFEKGVAELISPTRNMNKVKELLNKVPISLGNEYVHAKLWLMSFSDPTQESFDELLAIEQQFGDEDNIPSVFYFTMGIFLSTKTLTLFSNENAIKALCKTGTIGYVSYVSEIKICLIYLSEPDGIQKATHRLSDPNLNYSAKDYCRCLIAAAHIKHRNFDLVINMLSDYITNENIHNAHCIQKKTRIVMASVYILKRQIREALYILGLGIYTCSHNNNVYVSILTKIAKEFTDGKLNDSRKQFLDTHIINQTWLSVYPNPIIVTTTSSSSSVPLNNTPLPTTRYTPILIESTKSKKPRRK